MKPIHTLLKRLADQYDALKKDETDIAKLATGEVIDKLSECRDVIRDMGSVVKRLESDKAALEAAVLGRLDTDKVTASRGQRATASISESVVPSVKDWDAFYTYIFRNKASHLLERRPAAAPYREELEGRNGKPIPGVESFKRRTINLRTL